MCTAGAPKYSYESYNSGKKVQASITEGSKQFEGDISSMLYPVYDLPQIPVYDLACLLTGRLDETPISCTDVMDTVLFEIAHNRLEMTISLHNSETRASMVRIGSLFLGTHHKGKDIQMTMPKACVEHLLKTVYVLQVCEVVDLSTFIQFTRYVSANEQVKTEEIHGCIKHKDLIVYYSKCQQDLPRARNKTKA